MPGSGAVRGRLGHKGGVLMNGISALLKGTQRNPLTLTLCRYSEQTDLYEPGSRLSPDNECVTALISDFPAPRTVRNEFLFFISHPVYGIFVTYQAFAAVSNNSSSNSSKVIKIFSCVFFQKF